MIGRFRTGSFVAEGRAQRRNRAPILCGKVMSVKPAASANASASDVVNARRTLKIASSRTARFDPIVESLAPKTPSGLRIRSFQRINFEAANDIVRSASTTFASERW